MQANKRKEKKREEEEEVGGGENTTPTRELCVDGNTTLLNSLLAIIC